MNEMYEMITKKKKAQQDAEKALLTGRPSKGMYQYDSDEDTEGRTCGSFSTQRSMIQKNDFAHSFF